MLVLGQPLGTAGLLAGGTVLQHLAGSQDALGVVTDDPAQDLFQAAETAWQARQWQEAAATYNAFLRQHPTHSLAAQAHLRLGTYLSFTTDPEESMAEYAHAIAQAPNTRAAQEAQLGIAALYCAQGDYPRAREVFREVLIEARDWDVVKYATYRLKEIDRYRLPQPDRQPHQAAWTSQATVQCGVLALATVFQLKGVNVSAQEIEQTVAVENGMASLAALRQAAEARSIPADAVQLRLEQLHAMEMPLIAHLRSHHYVVVTDVANATIQVVDPHGGDIVFDEAGFQRQWTGYALVFPQSKQLIDPIALLSEAEMRRIRGGHHLHGNNLGDPTENPPSGFDPGPSPPPCNEVGLPKTLVNLSNFNFLVQDTEFSYAGRGPRVLVRRTYNADDPEEGAFGRSWTFNYEVELAEEPGGDVSIKE